MRNENETAAAERPADSDAVEEKKMKKKKLDEKKNNKI